MAARALMPDYLRLVALFGIVAVNVEFMAFPTAVGFLGAMDIGLWDSLAIWAVRGFALLKTYGLFAFMFGVGLALQMRSAARRGLDFGRLYRNRMFGLALLGFLHGVLFFPGDILLLYSITGAVLYRWRRWQVARLVRVGIALLVVQVIVAVPVMLALGDVGNDAVALQIERDVMTNGSWLTVLAYRAASFALIFPLLLILQGASALGWFCLGLAAVESGMIDDPAHALWARARFVCLLPGVALSLLGAALWQSGGPYLGQALVVFAAPWATVGYLGLIAAMIHSPGPVTRVALAVGASSLTIYLGQSIVLSSVFAPYGVGLWGAVSPVAAIFFAFACTLLLMVSLLVWRRVFALGPFEWLLRRITYIGTRGCR